jgi:hypothetical protein
VRHQLVNSEMMFRRDWEEVLEAELVKLVRQTLAAWTVDLVHRQRDWLAQFAEHLGQIAIGARQLAAAVDQEDDARP